MDMENEIQAKGPAAPRVTLADVEASIASEHYFTAAHGIEGAMSVLGLHQRYADVDTAVGRQHVPGNLHLVTFCVLVLRNGHRIVGINYGSIDPEQFSADTARKEARKAAVDQIWPLLGYELRTKLAQEARRPNPAHGAPMPRGARFVA